MTVGIVGLGLIGGSLAKAYKKSAHTVYAYNRSRETLDTAISESVAEGELTPDKIKECDLILICLYPDAAIEYLRSVSEYISKNTIVIDCCGTKEKICKAGFALAKQYGYTFIGGHPMAGTQFSGYKYSKSSLFKGAYMVLVPSDIEDTSLIDTAKYLLSPAEFGQFSIVSAEKHDKIIAFTSQLAHVVSNAYVKSPSARIHKGFSAGSYKDLTRVAWLNENMWTELCMENRENMIFELQTIISELNKYKEALENKNEAELKALFAEGKKIKNEIDG